MGEFYRERSDSDLALEAAYKKLQKLLAEDALREDDQAFIELYGEDEVKKDKAYVEGTEKMFADRETPESRERKIVADIIEFIIYEQSEAGNWFGENAHSIKTSKYDDYKNDVDMIIEFSDLLQKEKLSHLGLAVDITYGKEFSDKFSLIKEDIKIGRLSEVKYFKSWSPEKKQPARALHNIPRIVLNIDPKIINELIELWVSKGKTALGGHSIQIQVMYQVIAQLKAFEKYARANSPRKEVANAYRLMHESLNKVRKQKEAQFPKFAAKYSLDELELAFENFLDR